MNRLLLFSTLFFVNLSILYAQPETDTIAEKVADPVLIQALRLDTENRKTPIAVSVIDGETVQKGNQQLGLQESVVSVPGLFAINQDNFAQDLRLSIRGFGARAAFGIRGIKLLVDGIPESTPDGQAQVDNLDMGVVRQMQIVRGPASGLYGNASGGVLVLQTEEAPEKFMAEGRATLGSFGFQRYQFKTGFRKGAFSSLIYGSHTNYKGYRTHSEMKNTLLNGRFRFDLDSASHLTFLVNFVNSPMANDPGGVDSVAFTDQPELARDRNELFDSGESVTQGRIAASLRKQLGNHSWFESRAYYLRRDFANKLPFGFGGAVQIDRNYIGGGTSFHQQGSMSEKPWHLHIGIDIDYQADDRLRFMNNEGVLGDKTFDQLESFFSAGTFASWQMDLHDHVHAHASVRYDALVLKAEDRFLSNGDDSGELSFNQLNPMIGLSVDVVPSLSLYGNVATSFETPALSELSANPDGGGGFNPQLKPQNAINFELGAKGYAGKLMRYSVALFYIDVNNELVPYELAAFPDREFYRNAGNSRRLGAELFAEAFLTPSLKLTASYTRNQFTYLDYLVNEDRFDGNFLPGIPKQTAYLGLNYSHSAGFYAKIWWQQIGGIYANDGNDVETDAYLLLNARVGWEIPLSWGLIEPFAGGNNLLDTHYSGNIRINAFGGRFYEPAPGIHAFGGVRVRIGK